MFSPVGNLYDARAIALVAVSSEDGRYRFLYPAVEVPVVSIPYRPGAWESALATVNTFFGCAPSTLGKCFGQRFLDRFENAFMPIGGYTFNLYTQSNKVA
jgi:hypothetical protein